MSRQPPTSVGPERWRGREWAYPAIAPVVSAAGRVLFDLEVRGLAHVPQRGPVLVMANHVSHLDPIALLMALRRGGRRPRFVALADLWRVPMVGWLLEHGRMIPVRRGAGVAPMVDAACAALEAGEAVVVYPEGQLPVPGEPVRPRVGAGELAARARCPVVPAAMSGVEAYAGRLPRLRQPARVHLGTPVELGPVDEAPDAARVAGRRVLDAIHALP